VLLQVMDEVIEQRRTLIQLIWALRKTVDERRLQAAHHEARTKPTTGREWTRTGWMM